jgi:hypothetical protein
MSGQRFTYLLRPNVFHPDHHAPGGLDTPPMTDTDYSSQLDTESEDGSLDTDSDIEQHPSVADGPLSTISEYHISTSPVLAIEPRSAVEDTDVELESDASLAVGMDGLSFLPAVLESIDNPAPQISSGQSLLCPWLCGHHHRQERATSSPSQSPACKSCCRKLQHLPHHSNLKDFSVPCHHQTFYNYLFS